MKRIRLATLYFSCGLLFGILQFSDSAGNETEPNCEEAIGCECVDFQMVTGVTCDNVTDFGRFTEKLSDGSLYKVNETYEITLTGVETLPANFLQGLIVFRLYIDNPATSNISEQAFEGVIRLRRFHVRTSSVTVLPNFTAVSHSLRNLNFDNSLLTSVGTELQNLPLLQELTLRKNSIRTIATDALYGTDGLLILDFSKNLLESLPPDLLDSKSKLKKLVLSYNKLHTVHGLLKITRPEYIFLDSNNLTDADDILYENMTSVEMLELSHNPLRNVSNQSFNGKIPKVDFLYLDFCEITEFDVENFRNLSLISILDLTGNFIETIPNQVIDFGENLQLLFGDNRISSFEAEITHRSKRLYLSRNQLRFLGSTLHLTQLAEVEVNENFLEALIETDFRGAHLTENLSLFGNRIKRIDTAVFVSIRNDLQNLDLSVNLIESLNGSVRFLSQLKSLNISRNAITVFQEGEFAGLNELSELFMQHNKIISLGGQLQRIHQLQYVILQHNQLTTLKRDDLPKSLRFIYFKDNPLVCDCRLFPFFEWLNTSSSPETDVSYCQITDHEKILKQRSRHERCPPLCTCYCTRDTNDSYIAVDCRGRNISYPPAIFRSKDSNNDTATTSSFLFWHPTLVQQNTNDRLLVSDRVLSLNVENNTIESLEEWNLPFDLKELKIANNKLVYMPPSILKLPRLKRVTLTDNPWSCNCEAVEFKKWITSNAHGVLDANSTFCSSSSSDAETAGKLLASLSDVDLCPTFLDFYITVSFSVLSVLLLILATKITYNRYELNIKVWLYAHGVTWVKEDDLDKGKIFDAFLSFSHQDEEFVTNQLVAEIEERMPDIRLCLHYRNFLPGEFIHNNIMNAVQNSKRTVLVLTKNFLESEWCLLEFRAAHLQAMEDKVVRIVVIKVGDLPDDIIDPAIKAYLKTTTYVTFGEKYFWEKLLYALPEPTKYTYQEGSSTKLVDFNPAIMS